MPEDQIEYKPKHQQDDITEEMPTTDKPNRKRLKIGLIIAGAVVLALAIAGAIYAAFFMSQVSNEIKIPENELSALDKVLEKVDSANEPFYALIIGSDSRDASNSEAGLSDTLMLARIDPTVPQLTILSIPRDVEVVLDNHGNQKINAAFTFDGPAGAVDAVSDLCGVPISHYVEIDFNGVISLVDTLGGIDVVVSEPIELDGVYIPAGEQHLTGEQALIMSRNRNYPTGDLVRVENQRIILQAVVMEVLASDITSMPGLITELATNVKTTVDVSEVIELAMKFRGMDSTQMHMATIPTEFNAHDGVSYLAIVQPDFDNMMARVDEGLSPIDPEAVAAEAVPEEVL